MRRTASVLNQSLIVAIAALGGWLAFPDRTHAQFGGFGGGGGFSGGFGGGGGFSGGFGGGGGFSGGGFSGSNNLPPSQGFRPTPNYTTTGAGFSGSRPTTSMGQLGGFGAAGGGLLGGALGMTGGQMTGGFTGLGGNLGRGGIIVPTHISGAALGDALKPPLPAFPEIQTHLEKLLDNATGSPGGRNIEVGLQGTALVLRGAVKNDYEKRLAESFAQLEPGVREVRNELTAGTTRQRSSISRTGPGP